MSKYLIKTTEVYRVDTESEVEAFLNEAKNDNQYELVKYSSQHKELKKQGEVLDDWFQVQLVKAFTNEKEPDRQVEVHYGKQEVINSAF